MSAFDPRGPPPGPPPGAAPQGYVGQETLRDAQLREAQMREMGRDPREQQGMLGRQLRPQDPMYERGAERRY